MDLQKKKKEMSSKDGLIRESFKTLYQLFILFTLVSLTGDLLSTDYFLSVFHVIVQTAKKESKCKEK